MAGVNNGALAASEVTVFVVFNLEEVPTPVHIRAAVLHVSREQPRWSIGAVSYQSFRLGRYDQLPVLVTLRHDPEVLEESQLMAKCMDVTSAARQRVELGSTRFEFFWDLRQDEDVVLETATLILGCAQALAQLSKGVILVGGTRLIPNDVEFLDQQAYSALFPT